MKIQRVIKEKVVMTGEEVKSFITKYIERKTKKKVVDIELSESDYVVTLEDEHSDEDLGE